MSGNRSEDEAELAPAGSSSGAEYHRDFYSWLMEQARHLRAGRWTALDRENLAEEIESLGREQFNKLESALRVLILHMLKWDHQAERRGRSWSLSIRQQRLELDDIIADNPGLRGRIPEAITRAYRKARLQAANETGIDEDRFPQSCPYTWVEIVSREFSSSER
jgi:Domain of unknown function DUF29